LLVGTKYSSDQIRDVIIFSARRCNIDEIGVIDKMLYLKIRKGRIEDCFHIFYQSIILQCFFDTVI